MVHNVNDYVTDMSNMLRVADMMIIDIERGEDMLKRLTDMPDTGNVPVEIRQFVRSYANVCSTVSVESSKMNVMNTISSILDGLKRAIIRVCEILKEIFLYLFNSQYRSRKVFVDMQRTLMGFASNPDAVKEFESIQCTVLSQKDVMQVLEKSANLVNLIRFVGESTDNDSILRLLTQFSTIAGVTWGNERLEDACKVLAARRYASFAAAGWTLDGLEKAIGAMIDRLSGIEILKDTQTKIEKDIKQLERKVTDTMHGNVSVDMIKPLQMQIAIKVRITKVISSAINILITRSAAISNILRAINEEAAKIAKTYSA